MLVKQQSIVSSILLMGNIFVNIFLQKDMTKEKEERRKEKEL